MRLPNLAGTVLIALGVVCESVQHSTGRKRHVSECHIWKRGLGYAKSVLRAKRSQNGLGFTSARLKDGCKRAGRQTRPSGRQRNIFAEEKSQQGAQFRDLGAYLEPPRLHETSYYFDESARDGFGDREKWAGNSTLCVLLLGGRLRENRGVSD